MENKMKNLVSMFWNILYTMSANLAGGTLLAKALQSFRREVNGCRRNVVAIHVMY